jgi:hypothetical protein
LITTEGCMDLFICARSRIEAGVITSTQPWVVCHGCIPTTEVKAAKTDYI